MKLKVNAKLDPQFQPLSLVCRDMREATKDNGQDLVIAVERNKGYTVTYKTRVFPDGTGHDEENFDFVERMTKSLLWVAGGYKVIIAGSEVIGNKIKEAYTDGGLRDFDVHFMERVYEKPFEVEVRKLEDAPEDKSAAAPIGRHLDGCRIGFDAGGSDRKVSAVIDGESVYSEEVVWFPKTNTDPACLNQWHAGSSGLYHDLSETYRRIRAATTAAWDSVALRRQQMLLAQPARQQLDLSSA